MPEQTIEKTSRKTPKVLSVRRNPKMNGDLATIRQALGNDTDATQWALNIAANILRYAWLYGHEKPGSIPQMRVSYPSLPNGPQSPYDRRMTQFRDPQGPQALEASRTF